MSLATPPPQPPDDQCPDFMLLPPQAAGLGLRCQLPAGHAGHHRANQASAVPGLQSTQRVWPQAGDAAALSARVASGAKVTPLRKGKPS